MISMEMLGKIRRMYFRDKLLLHQIAKRTGLSRNTIRKWVRAPEATQPAYQRCATFNKLSPFHETLGQALKADSFRPKHNRRSAKALFEQIKAEGYDGGYSQLTAFVRSWRGEQGKSLRAFVPLTFALGEAFQFDWSEEGLLIGGIFRRIQVSHMLLDRLTHHCHIVETGNESYRLQHSTLAAQTKIKSRERKRKDGDDVEDDEPI